MCIKSKHVWRYIKVWGFHDALQSKIYLKEYFPKFSLVTYLWGTIIMAEKATDVIITSSNNNHVTELP